MMKKLSGAAAVLAALMMLFVAGCEQASGGGETPAPRVVTRWNFTSCENTIVSDILTNGAAEFYDDGTWKMGTLAAGTYEADTTKDAEFTAEVTTVMDKASSDMGITSADIVIEGNKLTVNIDLTAVTFGSTIVEFTRG